MNTLISLLIVLVSARTGMSGAWEGRSKLELRLRALTDEYKDALEEKLSEILDVECYMDIDPDLLEQKCFGKRKLEDLIKETSCCKEKLLLENLYGVIIDVSTQKRRAAPIPFPTDNVALFEHLLSNLTAFLKPNNY